MSDAPPDTGHADPIDDPDASLVRAAQSGDRRAMEDLLRRHYDRMFAICRRITGDDADAADAAQHAAISVVRALPGFDGRAKVSTWIHRIATNAALDELRRRRRRPTPFDAAPAEDHTYDDGRDSRLVDIDASARLDAIADRAELDTALATVPEVFRVPMIMRDLADLDYSEIAAALGVPIGTVKSRISRGRAAVVVALRDGNRPTDERRPSGDV